jgi:HTH-type transcriptional regulator/antitoxin HigA
MINYAFKENNIQLIIISMEALKYKVITTERQYKRYSKILEELVFSNSKSKRIKDEIDLLTLLIETWDKQHTKFEELDPIQLLLSLMNEHEMKAKDLAGMLDVSKGYISDILHYKKGLSKDIIRKLSEKFKVSQEAFNRPYKLRIIHDAHAKAAV